MKYGQLTTIDWHKKLKGIFLPHEVELYFPLIEEILELKAKKNAVFLGHNYMRPEVFLISDFHGDSLALAGQARDTECPIIVFNGVHFMAETAAILNPEKKVLLADLSAGCSLAESINAQQVRQLKQQYPNVPVVTYINCSAEVKAESDVCCTSANALTIIEKIPAQEIIFLPDRYLAENIQKQTKKKIIAWESGTCMVHEQYTPEDLAMVRQQYPDTVIIAHPECPVDVTETADFSGSTSQMSKFIQKSSQKNFFLVTECGMSDNLQIQHPQKNFISTCHTCPHMKKITLEKILTTLKNEEPQITIEEEIRLPALAALEKMFAYSL